MTPAEANKLLEAVKTKPDGAVRLKVVSSIENPEADGPGAQLQYARREHGLSIIQVAEALKLRPDQIAAIESMQFARLPGLGYSLGYVRAYAELLDIADVKSVVEDFKEAWSPIQRRHESSRNSGVSKFAVPIGFILAVCALVWLLISSFMHARLSNSKEVIAPPDDKIKAWASKDISNTQAINDTAPLATIIANRDVRIILKGQDGVLVADKVLKSGQTINVDGLGKWFVTTSDAGALEYSAFGETTILGENGQIVENLRAPDLEKVANDKLAAIKAEEDAKIAKEQARLAKLNPPKEIPVNNTIQKQ